MFISKILTIVIPCRNENDNILKCLAYLDNQYKIKKTRVIVADSSDDGTRDLIKPEDYKNIKVEIIDGGNSSVARNNGSYLAKTSYILFLDANILLKNTKIIDECLKDTICYGIDLMTIKFTSINKKLLYSYKIFEFLRYLLLDTPICFGGFMLMNKEVFMRKGRFDEKSIRFEDFQFSMKIHPKRFMINDFFCETNNRRFLKKGLFYMIVNTFKVYINKNNPQFFYK